MRIDLRPPPLSYPFKLLAAYSVAALAMGLLFVIAVTLIARPLIGGLVAMAYLIGVGTARFWRRPGSINHLITRLLHQI